MTRDQPEPGRAKRAAPGLLSLFAWAVVAASLYYVRHAFGYPLFHLIVELFAVVVAFGTFMIVWNARRYIENSYLLVVGIAYAWVAGVDLLHALTYQGVGLIPGAGAALATQLWLIARYLQASALVAGPLFIGRRVSPTWVMTLYAALTALLLTALMSGVFPEAFVEGVGLTPFKIGSEIAIIASFMFGLFLLQARRHSFDEEVLRLLTVSVAAAVLAEVFFTMYTDPFAAPNFLGHLLRVVAYYLFYRAVIALALDHPYRVLFRELAEEAEDLRASEDRLQSGFQEASVGIGYVGLDGTFSSVNRQFAALTGYSQEELGGMKPEDLAHPSERVAEIAIVAQMLSGELVEDETEARMVDKTGRTFWASLKRRLISDEQGRPQQVVQLVEDITARLESVQELQSARDLGHALAEIDRTALSSLHVEEMLARLVEKVGYALGADSAAIIVHEDEGWTVRYAYNFPYDVVGQVFPAKAVGHAIEAVDRGEPVAIDNAYDDPRVDQSLMREYQIRSVIVIPLRLGKQAGAVFVMHHRQEHSFTQEEREFARRLGAMLSVSVKNARLYAAEREIADTLQSGLLSVPGEIPGLEIAHAYQSATELARIGGDFFDLFEIRPGVAGVLIGDVSGKGLEAATFTAMARSTIRAFSHSEPSPAAVLTAANRAIVAQTGEVRFVTAVLMELDVTTGVVSSCCAGHPAPILCVEQGCADDISVRNPPLGVVNDLEFKGYEMRMAPGDSMVLFSDGLIEARRGDQLFGEEGVRDILARLAAAPPSKIVSSLLEGARKHADGSPSDDVAILVLKYLGPPDTDIPAAEDA